MVRAEQLLADDTVEAVRVMRARFSVTGESWETQIFERSRATDRRRAPIMVSAAPGEETWCETLDDFYGPDGRRAIASVLRNFLDRHMITPTELLHDPRYLRPLENQDGLIQAAVSRVAQQQATANGIDVRQRRDTIHRFIDEASRRAKAARGAKTMPVFDAGGFAGIAAAAAARSSNDTDRSFMIRFAASQKLGDAKGFGARLDMVMGWLLPPLAPPLLVFVDEFVSGLFGAANLVQEVIGQQPHLGAALLAIAELATGSHTGKAAGAPPALVPLAALLAVAPMSETRLVLFERLQREIGSDKPFSRDALGVQRQMFNQLLERLIDRNGLIYGGTAMIEALARRSRRVEVVGGIEPVRFLSTDPVARLEQLLDIARETRADRAARALATRMVDILDSFAGDPAPLRAIRPRVEASLLPDDAKHSVLSRLPVAVP